MKSHLLGDRQPMQRPVSYMPNTDRSLCSSVLPTPDRQTVMGESQSRWRENSGYPGIVNSITAP